MQRVTKNVLSTIRVDGQVVTDVDLSDIDALVKLAGLTNTIVLTRDSAVYYAPNGGTIVFESLNEALSQIVSFDGVIRIAEDMPFEEQIEMSGRNFEIDLNGHTISNCGGLSKTMFRLYEGSKLVIRNGSMCFSGEGTKFYIGYGNLRFENVKVDIDYSANTSVWNTELLGFSHRYRQDKADEGKGVFSIDKDTEIYMHDAKLGETLITTFSLFWTLKKAGVVSTKAEYEAYVAGRDVALYLVIDGRITVEKSGTDQYATITTGNGSDVGRMNITVGETAVIKTDIVGLYSGNDILITLKGGKIISKTGIIMRGGMLSVPEGAEPIVIGTGEYREYDPLHTMKTGSDHSMNLGLGHAVCLENNGPNSYGQFSVSADIRSGTFESYNNTPIAYYGIATDAGSRTTYAEYEEPNVSATYTYQQGQQTVTKTCHFLKRSDMVGFMKYGRLNRYSTEDDDVARYDFKTGHFPAAGIVAGGSYVNGFGAVCVSEPYCQ